MRTRARIGLALGGGGARGLAHLGVLKALQAHEIPIDMVAGTSIGALIGAAYALQPDAHALEQRTLEFVRSPQFNEVGLRFFKKKKDVENFFGQVASFVKERIVINLAPSRASLVGGWRLVKAVDFMLADGHFDDLQLPFVCVAAELTTGAEIVLRQGRLRAAVRASMSIPGFLPPVKFHGY